MDEKMCQCDRCGMEKMCVVGSKCDCGGEMKEKMEGGDSAEPAGGDMGGGTAVPADDRGAMGAGQQSAID